MVIYYIIAAICGVSVALAELRSRYKDEPIKAIWCRWGIFYLLFNGVLPLGAFWALIAAGTVTDNTSAIESFKFALYAGFGSVLVMRTKLFNLKTEGGEKLGIGPDFVIDTILNVLDRYIDRQRAYERARIVKEAMYEIDFNKARMPLIMLVTRSMQSITDSEMKELGRKLKDLEQAQELSNQEKSYALGFMLLDLAGEAFFIKVFDSKERQKYKAP